MMLKVKIIALLVLLVVVSRSFLHVKNNRIVDEKGAEFIFHGLNIVQKNPPYITHFNETHMKQFQSKGINGIRLGVMWPGVEPKQGQFNQTYLQQMLKIVENAGKYGIYTLVQFHQDLFSQKFCADGVPIWAIQKSIYKNFPEPLSKPYQFDGVTGKPRWQDCGKHPWGDYYFSFSVNKAFGSLWKNKHGLLDKFINYWKKVITTFNNSQYVIAYELMNEPWPGNLFENPLVMVPGLSQVFHLQPAYDKIVSELKKINTHQSICFQPVTWLNNFPTGFTHPPGGKKYQNQSIFCYHYYNPPTLNLNTFMNQRMRDVKRLNVGGILSQFYVIDQQGQKNVQMMNKCDQHHQSWFGWCYQGQVNSSIRNNFFDKSEDNKKFEWILDQKSSFKSKVIEGVTRTFAPIVGGKTIRQFFDPTSKTFSLTYEFCRNCGQTLIFYSQEHIYNKGSDIQCYPRSEIQCIKEGQFYIKVKPSSSLQQKSLIQIVIRAL